MDMSNKSLALLLVAAIVISLGGTLISLQKIGETGITGMAESGKINVSVTSNAACKIDSNVSFGSGYPPTAGTYDLSSNIDNSAFEAGFTDCSGSNCGMQINNTGNEDLNVNFTSSVAASGFVGGPNVVAGDFAFMSRDGDNSGSEGGCQAGTQTWTDVTTSETVICSNLTPSASADMMTIEYNVTLREDTPTGSKGASITIDCSQA